MPARETPFSRFGWGVLVYTIFVVLFGAYVRITGSGAGCGQHWPTCHGELVPRAPALETIIEFTHRATSGVYGLLVLALLVWALRRFPRGHLARIGAVWTLVFTISEALVGAGLVKFGLVAEDDSIARAVVMAIHLINTSFLTGALALTCWAGARPLPARPRQGADGRGRVALILFGCLFGLILVGITGAVTALGDTLYPVAHGPIVERLQRDQSISAHFLERLRIMHPMLAVGVGALVLFASQSIATRDTRRAVQRWALAVSALVVAQVTAGVVNIMLSAPGWMQIIHLLIGTLLWTALVLLTASALERR
ncbi:MAG: COX15/CtaA family protein [Myxococcales bacterium]|nr:COX15/CtaA family protein [Myxococcales bacterium]MCB9753450.1 COX15/CtaA family protein [Myxococcales bacterium]